MNGKTVLMIAHRLTTVQMRIVFLLWMMGKSLKWERTKNC